MKSLLLFCSLFFFSISYAQITDSEDALRSSDADTVDGWRVGGTTSLNLSQASFTNWAAGGESSLSFYALGSFYAHLTKKKTSWENYLDLGYGLMKQGKSASFFKTDDKIDFSTKYGRKFSENWFYSAMVNFKTQFDEGFNTPDDTVRISNFMAPGYTIAALGLDYNKGENFSLFIAPITGKFTFVLDQELANKGAFGVDPALYDDLGVLLTQGASYRSEFGGYIRFFYRRDIMENVNFQTKLDLFSNYLDRPENIDVNWEVLISMKINDFLSATLLTHLIYDHDIKIDIDDDGDGVFDRSGPRTQFKELLGVGLTYTFD